MVFRPKSAPPALRSPQRKAGASKQKNCLEEDITRGDCWIGIAQAKASGLILAYKVGKHRDKFIEEIIINTEIKTESNILFTDGWKCPGSLKDPALTGEVY